MDPDEALAELRRLAHDYTEDQVDDEHEAALRLIELFQALDQWVCNGGFLPAEWTEALEPSLNERCSVCGVDPDQLDGG